jgi:hypothetical protein
MPQLKPGARTCRYCTESDGMPMALAGLAGQQTLPPPKTPSGTQDLHSWTLSARIWYCERCGYTELPGTHLP